MKEAAYRADIIRAEMGRHNISLEKLAELAGVTRQTVRAIRGGADTRVSTLRAIADALKIDMSDLFSEEAKEADAA